MFRKWGKLRVYCVSEVGEIVGKCLMIVGNNGRKRKGRVKGNKQGDK